MCIISGVRGGLLNGYHMTFISPGKWIIWCGFGIKDFVQSVVCLLSHFLKVLGLLKLIPVYLFQVGTYYKTPKYPIWIVCSESHFSVLFSMKLDLISDWRAERRFDLYYYDGLARQQDPIRLTIG